MTQLLRPGKSFLSAKPLDSCMDVFLTLLMLISGGRAVQGKDLC